MPKVGGSRTATSLPNITYAAGQGRKPEARPRHGAAGLRLIPEHGAVDAVG